MGFVKSDVALGVLGPQAGETHRHPGMGAVVDAYQVVYMTGYMLGGIRHSVQPPLITDVSGTDRIWASCHRGPLIRNRGVEPGFG